MIFDMFLNQDMSVNAIAKYLRTNEIPTPSAYMGYKYTKVNRPYDWSFPIVSRILKFQEYCGDTVNFKTYHTSFKDKKVRKNSREDYVIIHDTQEPIISREEFEKARKEEMPIREFQLKNNFVCLTVWYSAAIEKQNVSQSQEKKINSYIHLSLQSV